MTFSVPWQRLVIWHKDDVPTCTAHATGEQGHLKFPEFQTETFPFLLS